MQMVWKNVAEPQMASLIWMRAIAPFTKWFTFHNTRMVGNNLVVPSAVHLYSFTKWYLTQKGPLIGEAATTPKQKNPKIQRTNLQIQPNCQKEAKNDMWHRCCGWDVLHASVNQDSGRSFVKQIEQWPRTWRGLLIEEPATHITTHPVMTMTKTHKNTHTKTNA